MATNTPPPDDDDILKFWDCLSHDLGMFAGEPPERVLRDEIEQAREVAEIMKMIESSIEALKNGQPRPRRPPLPEPAFTVDYLPHHYQVFHERAQPYPTIIALFGAYRSGLTGDAARRHAGLDVEAYHDAPALLDRWFRDLDGN